MRRLRRRSIASFFSYKSFSATYRHRRVVFFSFFPLHGGFSCPQSPFPPFPLPLRLCPIPAQNKKFSIPITGCSFSSCSVSSPRYPPSLPSGDGQKNTGIPSQSLCKFPVFACILCSALSKFHAASRLSFSSTAIIFAGIADQCTASFNSFAIIARRKKLRRSACEGRRSASSHGQSLRSTERLF